MFLGEKCDSNRFESCMRVCGETCGTVFAAVLAGAILRGQHLLQYLLRGVWKFAYENSLTRIAAVFGQRPNVSRYNATAIDYKMMHQLAWGNIVAQYGNIFDTILKHNCNENTLNHMAKTCYYNVKT